MKNSTIVKIDPKKAFAAQNAQQGLISANDLSLLTGVEASRLNSFAKKGFLGHYGEYHGKRFFNFEEIINWLNEPGDQDEAKLVICATMKTTLRDADCPYTLEKTAKESRVRIIWKDIPIE